MSYKKVIKHIEASIISNEIKPGSKLPAFSVMSKELDCSEVDVYKAYNILVEYKVAYAIENKIFYLMKNAGSILISEKIYFDSLIFKPSILGVKVEVDMSDVSMENREIQGHCDLRNSLVDVFKSQKIFTDAKRVTMTSHLKEAFDLILNVVVSNNENILIENPTHPDIIKHFKYNNSKYVYNRVEDMDYNLLELLFIQNNIKVFVLQGDESLPYGKSMSLEDKLKLLELCEKYDVYLIDIDFSSENKPYVQHQTLFSLDQSERVFHIKTFHQYYSENINIVAFATPEKYRKSIVDYKEKHYGESSIFEQILLNQVLENDLEVNKLRCQKIIKKRYDFFMSIYNKYQSKLDDVIKINDQKSHMFIMVNSEFDLKAMSIAMANKNIKMANVEDFYFTHSYTKGFLLSLTSHDCSDLEKGLNEIFDYILKHKEATWQ